MASSVTTEKPPMYLTSYEVATAEVKDRRLKNTQYIPNTFTGHAMGLHHAGLASGDGTSR